MTSSNRHWPSLFKSKPCSTQQWTQNDINIPSSHVSTACPKLPYTSVSGGGGDRAPEPKPRWNPRPEQIRILEGIFNSGMVNPPRDEIRRIRVQLQEYGQVGDANIFYWFQNRKSRSKHKQRLQQQQQQQKQSPRSDVATAAACSSSSSSSDPSTPAVAKATKEAAPTELRNTSPTGSVNQTPHENFHHQPSSYQVFPQVQGYGTNYHDCVRTATDGELGLVPAGFWSELVCHEGCRGSGATGTKSVEDDEGKAKLLLQYSLYGEVPSANTTTTTTSTTTVTETANPFPTTSANYVVTAPNNNTISSIDFEHGNSVDVGNYGGVPSSRSMVFINEVAFEVGNGPVNIREAFGQEALLFNSSGLPVLVDDWGVTLQPLQPGASYYLG